MKIGILGTGIVGRVHAEKLASLGHSVVIGTQDTTKTMARTDPDMMGNQPFAYWLKSQEHPVKLGTQSEAAAHGELVINALNGNASLSALTALALQLKGKDLIDISNPLDFSKGMPPSLFVCNTDSLAEQIQKALPDTHVIKTLNTMNAYLQVDAMSLASGAHSVFISGNDSAAKARVIGYLKTWYGWKDVIDLGDISSARGTEMLLPVWLRLWGKLQNPNFNFKIVVG